MSMDEAVDGQRQQRALRPCVVLVHGAAPPASLLWNLRRRGIGITLAHAPAEVMASLARLREPGALIIVNPDQPRRAELIDVVGRYHPAVGVWGWRAADATHSDGRQRLVRLLAATQAKPPGHAPHDAGPRDHARRDATDFFENGGLASPAPENKSKTRPLVSSAELAMLLGGGDETTKAANEPSTVSQRASQPDRKEG